MNRKPAFLSKIAEWQLDNILDFIEKKWSLKVRNEFLEKFTKSVDQIEIYPKGSPEILERKNIRKKIVTELTSLYYVENKTDIDIIAVFDNRQNPRTILKKIKRTFGQH